VVFRNNLKKFMENVEPAHDFLKFIDFVIVDFVLKFRPISNYSSEDHEMFEKVGLKVELEGSQERI